jgi:translation initiation factor 5A
MPLKLVNAVELKSGSSVIIDNAPCVVRSIDISKTGKHGSSKARIEAVGIIDGKKRIIISPGHDKLPVPLIEKRKGQVLTLSETSASLMDSENYETLEVLIVEELRGQIKEGMEVEYWDIEGQKIIKRTISAA